MFQIPKKTIDSREAGFLDDFNKYYREIYLKNKLHKMKIIFFDEKNEPFRSLTVDKNGSINIFVNLNERMDIERRIGDWLNRVNGRQTYIE